MGDYYLGELAPDQGLIKKFDSGLKTSSGGIADVRIHAGYTAETYKLLSAYLYLHCAAGAGNRYLNLGLFLGLGKNPVGAQAITGVRSTVYIAGGGGSLGIGPQQLFTNCTDGNTGFCGIGDGLYFSGDDYIKCWLEGPVSGDVVQYWLQFLYLTPQFEEISQVPGPRRIRKVSIL